MFMPMLKGVKNRSIYIQGAEVKITTDKNIQPDKLIIYLHGGGFIFGILPIF